MQWIGQKMQITLICTLCKHRSKTRLATWCPAQGQQMQLINSQLSQAPPATNSTTFSKASAKKSPLLEIFSMPEIQVGLHMGFEISWVAYGASMFQSRSSDSTKTTCNSSQLLMLFWCIPLQWFLGILLASNQSPSAKSAGGARIGYVQRKQHRSSCHSIDLSFNFILSTPNPRLISCDQLFQHELAFIFIHSSTTFTISDATFCHRPATTRKCF